ncbi:uncharacterized protein [Amphiura filiformis]|uniref:uncharacterized protein n=1 Tax=Amphiura filiformis TaxID=82378 RepID=UPI003B2263BE
MEPSKSTENLAPKMSSENGRIQLVLVVIAVVVAVVALVVACVGLSLKGTTQITIPDYANGGVPSSLSSSGTSSGKIWSIAIGHANYNEAYIDEKTGTLKGFLIDIANAVCKYGNKNCRIVYDVWTHCWNSESGQVSRGGLGLMSDWYDACTGWYGTYDRYRTFTFSDPYGRGDPESLYAKPGSPLVTSWREMAGKKIGILDGWWTDEICLNRNADRFTSGTPFTSDRVIHYAQPEDLVEAVMNGDIDYGFQSESGYIAQELQRVEGDPVIPCAVHGPSTMTRKVNQEFLNWWNEAQKRLMATTEYTRICQDMEDREVHGHKPGQTAEEYCFL